MHDNVDEVSNMTLGEKNKVQDDFPKTWYPFHRIKDNHGFKN